jgi:hypothetical protein
MEKQAGNHLLATWGRKLKEKTTCLVSYPKVGEADVGQRGEHDPGQDGQHPPSCLQLFTFMNIWSCCAVSRTGWNQSLLPIKIERK